MIGGLARGSLELGAINVTAPALDPASIREVVASEHGTLQGCYVQALDEAPDLSGTLEVTFSIGGDGRVTQVEGRGDGPLVAAGVEACVVEAFRGFTFPASNEPRTTTVTYPLTFTPR